MSSVAHSLRRIVSRGRTAPAVAASVGDEPAPRAPAATAVPVDIAPNDPIIPFFQSAAGAVDIEALELESPALAAMRAAGVKLVVPLVTQGELIGLLNLGPRLSDQEYSGDDRRLLESLAAQAAPAVRVGQLVREQEVEIRSRERIEQELAVARLIQQNFLPRTLPEAAGWSVAADRACRTVVGGNLPIRQVRQLAREELLLDQRCDAELLLVSLAGLNLGRLLLDELGDPDGRRGLGREAREQPAVVR